MKFVVAFTRHENAVEKQIQKAKHKVYKRAGAYVRKIARDMVRHKSNPNVASTPLSPPYNHFGLKRTIEFADDKTGVYIGPKLIRGGLNNVARRHEFGGRTLVKDVNPKWMKKDGGVEVGDTAPLHTRWVSKRDEVVRQDRHDDPKTGRKVYWVKIRTKTQAMHSTRLYRRMAPKYAGMKSVYYPPRPFMVPALEKALPHLSPMWKNALSE